MCFAHCVNQILPEFGPFLARKGSRLQRDSINVADGGEDDYAETWGLLFDAGSDAQANGVPFDEGRTQPWKEGWIAADINVGLAGFED
jgi:hypothetical protein